MNVPQDSAKPRAHSSLHQGRLKIVWTLSGIALLLFIGMQWPRRSSDAARVPEPASGSESQNLTPPFEYFPAQYRNNAQIGLPEEHIQAF